MWPLGWIYRVTKKHGHCKREQQAQNRAERGVLTLIKCFLCCHVASVFIGCDILTVLCGEHHTMQCEYSEYTQLLHWRQFRESRTARGTPSVLKLYKLPFGYPTTHVRVGKQKLGPYGKQWVTNNVFGYSVGPSIINLRGSFYTSSLWSAIYAQNGPTVSADILWLRLYPVPTGVLQCCSRSPTSHTNSQYRWRRRLSSICDYRKHAFH